MRRYEIRLAGQLDSRWSAWFEGFRLTSGADGFTTLTSPLIDQAALHGLLRRVGDLGLTIISINALDDDAIASPSRTSHS
ncbi:hypothetical protein E3O25_01900 [Cryobacterium sp. TMT1-3]|uniref:hypothetical protein n=1 Tax=Cryobacterium sp. TMT1-3 TaxID=1259237 RepID=UPI00106DBA93|nr:hypothetical protein [Cryobacterium sp. TMT1-3]TFC31234.1 hypothetical protein E3O25_01900 [Cryobacterium sp. TMT1-3]